MSRGSAPSHRPPGRSLRIGLIGGVAAASYSLARILRDRGHDAVFLKDPSDTYSMSQPGWEDIELELEPSRAAAISLTDWERLATENGWRQPDWVQDLAPNENGGWPHGLRRSLTLARRLTPALYRALAGYLRANSQGIGHLAEFDWLIVCGVRVVDAYLSGVPYAYWPHGGDLRVVPNLHEHPNQELIARAIRVAVGKAEVAGTHDPSLADELERVGGRRAPPFLGLPIDTNRYAPATRRPPARLLAEALTRAGDRKLVLLSARQDFHWKATDRFIRAFIAACRQGAQLFLVMCPWGVDAAEVDAMLRDSGMEHAVHRLPALPSKPLLMDLYRSADVVVDQFALGVYGSTMLEAMACGAPVMISLDAERFTRRWPEWTPPPVINATGEDEILASLLSLDRDELALDRLSEDSRAWVLEFHGPAAADRFLPPC